MNENIKNKCHIKKVAAVHDLSCYGRSSLMVIIPILSAMGHQVVPFPNSILTTHTGGFGEVFTRDLTDFLPEMVNKYDDLRLKFDAVYTGYMPNLNQIDITAGLLLKNKEAIKLVDPVMADHGRLYKGLPPKIIDGMKYLVSLADIITPNLTEACFISGREYSEKMTQEQIDYIIKSLSTLGPKQVVITGVPQDGLRVNIAYDAEADRTFIASCQNLSVSFPGTGDSFSSLFLGGTLRGMGLKEANQFATTFIYDCIKETISSCTPAREGILLEKMLYKLI